jgi:predicted nucleotidyltransferase component of viral defense system
MPKIPLALKLRKRNHKAVAYAQDLVVMQVYEIIPQSVIHGGTAIWRCYGGNRFSEDVDTYLPKLTLIQVENFVASLRPKGLSLLKSKVTSGALYVSFDYLGALVRFEGVVKRIKDYVVRPYETVDGNFISVRTLSPEKLIAEKVLAYISRKKVRDLYDIYFLISVMRDSSEVSSKLKEQMQNLDKPVDESVLKSILIAGAVPRALDMLEVIRRWAA